jgi:hypothetical protein
MNNRFTASLGGVWSSGNFFFICMYSVASSSSYNRKILGWYTCYTLEAATSHKEVYAQKLLHHIAYLRSIFLLPHPTLPSSPNKNPTAAQPEIRNPKAYQPGKKFASATVHGVSKHTRARIEHQTKLSDRVSLRSITFLIETHPSPPRAQENTLSAYLRTPGSNVGWGNKWLHNAGSPVLLHIKAENIPHFPSGDGWARWVAPACSHGSLLLTDQLTYVDRRSI